MALVDKNIWGSGFFGISHSTPLGITALWTNLDLVNVAIIG